MMMMGLVNMDFVVEVARFGQKINQSRLTRYGHVKHRDNDYVGRKLPEMQLPGKNKTGQTKEHVSGCAEGGHAGGRREGR